MLKELYAKLTPWQKTQVARHPRSGRISAISSQACARTSCRWPATVPLPMTRPSWAVSRRLGSRKVMLIGHERGHDTASRVHHNFGMGMPEGYRKAIRLMELADRFGLPVVTLVDTSGAFPGVQAEERGQAEAIARGTEACLALGVPLIAVIVGEGGSGGAVALAAGNRVLMFEHAIYSVISPRGLRLDPVAHGRQGGRCGAGHAGLGPASSPPSMSSTGSCRSRWAARIASPLVAIDTLRKAIVAELRELDGLKPDQLRKQRADKFLAIGD